MASNKRVHNQEATCPIFDIHDNLPFIHELDLHG